MSEEPTEDEKAEFDRIALELTMDTYTSIGRCISAWSTSEGIIVDVAAMLLDTKPEKAGLVFYSINNFHVWLSIIDELFAIDPQYSPLRPDWIEISKRLKKLNDTRVRLAHHALGPGKGIEYFVESDADLSGIFPTLKPNKSDSRMKSKKHTPLGLEELSTFFTELAVTQDKIRALIDRIEPIFLAPKQRLLATIKQLRQKAKEIAAQRGNSNS